MTKVTGTTGTTKTTNHLRETFLSILPKLNFSNSRKIHMILKKGSNIHIDPEIEIPLNWKFRILRIPVSKLQELKRNRKNFENDFPLLKNFLAEDEVHFLLVSYLFRHLNECFVLLTSSRIQTSFLSLFNRHSRDEKEEYFLYIFVPPNDEEILYNILFA
jgi:hypothetical protein